MIVYTQKSTRLIFYVLCLPLLATSEDVQPHTTEATTTTSDVTNTTSKDLVASESADPKKVDIVKQIRRLNEDGSYTVGYEAGDGTFKIESRDVRGNIKGTFGYVDNDGEIKRVSYSTSNTTQATPLRYNRTGSPTTRRPQLPTVVYPKSGSTRATVIQPIPRRRPVLSSSPQPNAITTTESYRVVSSNSHHTNATDEPKILKQYPIFTARTTTETIKAALLSEAESSTSIDPKIYRTTPDTNNASITTTVRSTLTFEKVGQKDNGKNLRANTFRRQLNPANFENEQMFAIRQSAGDDTTDVYGGSIALGTARPLFTTTTIRPRLVPIHTIITARQKALNERLIANPPQVHEEHETTLEATTNKIDAANYVTNNPVPLLQIPIIGDNEQRVIERPFLKPAITQFRTREFLRDNPGAAVPIGNQRVIFRYNSLVDDGAQQYIRQHITPPPQIPPPPNIVPVSNHIAPQNEHIQPEVVQEKPNLIAIPVQQLQGQRYQIFNPYIQQARIESIPPRAPPTVNEFKPITAPVRTKDLRRLLQQLLTRQNRIQALMDIRNDYTPAVYNHPYNPQAQQLFEPEYRQQKSVYSARSAYPQLQEQRAYNGYSRPRAPLDPNYQYQAVYPNQGYRNDYRPQDDGYRNDIQNAFDPATQYESQRYVPKRRAYRPRIFDPRYEDVNAVPEGESDSGEYLPVEVRESLLLKMLMLAINPDFNPPTDVQGVMMMTTQSPPPPPPPPQVEYRKKVRNVQILGEESDGAKDMMIELKRQERT